MLRISGWGRGPAPLPLDVQAALQELEHLYEAPASNELTAAVPREAVDLHRALIPAMWSTPAGVEAPSADPEQVADLRGEGVPLFRRIPPTWDRSALEERAQAVSRVLEAHRPQGGAGALRRVAAAGQLDWHTLAREVLREGTGPVAERAASAGLDAALLASVLRLALFPALSAVAHAARSALRDVEWSRGYCLLCGSWPLLGEERGLEQERVLRCGLCAAEWKVDRVLCHACGERDPETLRYLAPQGETSRYRVRTCESCGSYLKLVNTLQPLSAPGLLVMDLSTLPLDVIAQDAGYSSPG